MGRAPRQKGCKDLSEVERGVVATLAAMTLTVGGTQVQLGATHIAKGMQRSRAAVQKCISKKTHVKQRGAPKATYTQADVDKAQAVNEELRKKWHNKIRVTYAMIMEHSGWRWTESALRREFFKRDLKARPFRSKLQLSPLDVEERWTWCLAQMLRPWCFWERECVYVRRLGNTYRSHRRAESRERAERSSLYRASTPRPSELYRGQRWQRWQRWQSEFV